jgi:hypothetical protein
LTIHPTTPETFDVTPEVVTYLITEPVGGEWFSPSKMFLTVGTGPREEITEADMMSNACFKSYTEIKTNYFAVQAVLAENKDCMFE